LAEWAHLPITLPVDAWTTRIQTTQDKSVKPLAILCQMLSEQQNFYKGISAYVLLCLKPSLQYTVYEQVKQMIVAHRYEKSLSAPEAFLLGMLARTIATVLVLPCLRAKVVMQTRKECSAANNNNSSSESTGENAKEETMMQLLLRLARTNPAALYQGIVPELTRGVFSAALMLMLKERIAVMARSLAAK
jgi:adenine nucleotide transporter 17